MTARVVPDDAAGRDAAIEVLRSGGIVALPTDTVYGIAVALETPGGIERLFHVKHRPADKGIALLLDSAEQASTIGVMGPAATALAAGCWPGGLTLVVERRTDRAFPGSLTGGAATIGLRVPDHDAPRALARGVGPLPTTSANISGVPGGTRRRRDPRPARGRDRPDPRWRSRARRARVDGRGLHRGGAARPSRRGNHRRATDRAPRGGRALGRGRVGRPDRLIADAWGRDQMSPDAAEFAVVGPRGGSVDVRERLATKPSALHAGRVVRPLAAGLPCERLYDSTRRGI